MKRLEPLGILLAAGLVVLMAVLVLQRATAADAAGDALADAPVELGAEVATDFFTLDHRTLDDDTARVLALATGEFEAQYRKQTETLTASVRDRELVLTASVPDGGAALEYLTGDQAWVLVSVDVHTEGKDGYVDDGRYRTRVVLRRDESSARGWFVSRLEQVG